MANIYHFKIYISLQEFACKLLCMQHLYTTKNVCSHDRDSIHKCCEMETRVRKFKHSRLYVLFGMSIVLNVHTGRANKEIKHCIYILEDILETKGWVYQK